MDLWNGVSAAIDTVYVTVFGKTAFSPLYGDLTGVLPSPSKPLARLCVVEARGGTDKKADGHRADTVPICNGIIKAGCACEPIYYSDETSDIVKEYLTACDGVMVRLSTGTYEGVTQSKLDGLLAEFASKGKVIMSHPDVVTKMGAKDALCKISDLSCGLPDNLAYHSGEELAAGFRKTCAFQPRVIKQNRGSEGEGIWIVKLKEGNYCTELGERLLEDSEVLILTEANDNHVEEHTVAEFLEFCTNGRTEKSGEWTSTGVGKYLEGGKAAGGQLVDQRFCPRVVEGEVRCLMVGSNCIEIVHMSDEGGLSKYKPDAKQYTKLMSMWREDKEKVMGALGLSDQPLPLIWTCDFVLGEKDADGDDTYIAGRFDCSCVGITQQLYLADTVGAAAATTVLKSKYAALYGNLSGMVTKPVAPLAKLCILEVRGGDDKKEDGHRADTMPICNGIMKAGCACEPIYYSDETYELVSRYLTACDGVIVRINPGTYKGVTHSKLDGLLKELAATGKVIMSHPDVVTKMGAKDALCKINDLSCGLPDTIAYYSASELSAGFRKTCAFQPRVIKQNRGEEGEGVWIVKLKEGNYCKELGERLLKDEEVLILTEANDNHVEEHTVAEFLEFCTNGRTYRSGEWTSTGVGKYLEGGKAAGGQLVDQRFCPRVVEGEVRCLMVGSSCIEIVHKKPAAGGICATLKTGAIFTKYKPEDKKFTKLMTKWNEDKEKVMGALGLSNQPLPLIWTCDFILDKTDEDDNDTYIAGEFNGSCVGITQQLYLADTVGATAATTVLKSKYTALYGDLSGVLPAPESPSAKLCILEVRGGTDKKADGHRADTVPICNGTIKAGGFCEPIYYSDKNFDLVKEYLSSMDGAIVRVSPGVYEGVTQSKLDGLLAEFASKGKVIMSHPDVVTKMGAKDALCKISDLSCGLPDNLAYHSGEELAAGFRKTCAFQPRVIKQNRGSKGEGIWIVKLKEGNYCTELGERLLEDSEVLILTEANDNHVEEHTVAEFLEFCTNGRTEKSGEWTSTGVGKYLKGGKAAGGQLVDQRFCPRVVEGEVRCLMVGSNCIEIVHKKPADGGPPATLRSGATFTKFKPDAPEFTKLMSMWREDKERVMGALGLSDQPLPLIWTCDFVLGEKDADGDDSYVASEFDCSCVGITEQLYLADGVGKTALNTVVASK